MFVGSTSHNPTFAMLTFGDFLIITLGVAIGSVVAHVAKKAIDNADDAPCDDDEESEVESGSSTIHFIGLKSMYVVKADNPPVAFAINIQVADSEGNPLAYDPDMIESVDVMSTNPDLVQIEVDEDGDQLTGMVSFGRPSNDDTDIASVEARVKYAGVELQPVGAQFTITTGDPSSVTASITFDGLTETPTPEPETPPTE